MDQEEVDAVDVVEVKALLYSAKELQGFPSLPLLRQAILARLQALNDDLDDTKPDDVVEEPDKVVIDPSHPSVKAIPQSSGGQEVRRV